MVWRSVVLGVNVLARFERNASRVLLILAATLLLTHGGKVSHGTGSDVFFLGDDTIEHFTGFEAGTTETDWFLKFYVPGCNRCKKLEPIWENLATRAKKSGDNVSFAKVDASKERLTSWRFKAKKVPLLLLVSGGRVKTYKGADSEEDLYRYASGGHKVDKGRSLPGELGFISKHLTKLESAMKFISSNTLSRGSTLKTIGPYLKNIKEVLAELPRFFSSDSANEAFYVFLVVMGLSGMFAGLLALLFMFCWICLSRCAHRNDDVQEKVEKVKMS